jgi:hypothetical protein
MMMVEKKSTFAFMESWRAIDRSIIHIILLDFIYYTIFLFVGSFYVLRVLPWFFDAIEGAKILKQTAFATTAEFLAEGTAIQLQWSSFKLYTVAVFIIVLFNYVFFKYLIWQRILEKKEPLKAIIKNLAIFAVLNTFVAFVAIIILVLCYYMFVLEIFNLFFFFIVPLAALYTLCIIHPLFVQSKDIQKTAQEFFVVGIKNIYRWIIPFMFMALGIYLVMQTVPILLFLPDAVYFVWYVLCFAAYFSWSKYYIYEVIKKIEKRNKSK